jgi:transcriptional regulator with AAA-type ATPase domain
MSLGQQLMFGESGAIRKVLDQCERYAQVNEPLLILGAPGSDKTVIAP